MELGNSAVAQQLLRELVELDADDLLTIEQGRGKELLSQLEDQ
jgi:hypothetical protein